MTARKSRPSYGVPHDVDPHEATRDLGRTLQRMLDDLQRRPEHRTCIRPGQLVSKQAKRHCHQARANERDHLSGEQVAVGAVL